MLVLEAAVWAPNLFQQGGYFPMSVVTILLIALLLAAWKAPAWVKEIGLIALSFGFLWITNRIPGHPDRHQAPEFDF